MQYHEKFRLLDKQLQKTRLKHKEAIEKIVSLIWMADCEIKKKEELLSFLKEENKDLKDHAILITIICSIVTLCVGIIIGVLS